jgi:7,8-dihydroneopterin aldolase/epimerase/oxygenase
VSLTIELRGLELHAHHGVTDEERERGQTFRFDIWADLPDRLVSDRLAACVRSVSDSKRFNLLEALASELADTLLSQFELERVRVRVRKPEVRLEPPVDYAAVTVERFST